MVSALEGRDVVGYIALQCSSYYYLLTIKIFMMVKQANVYSDELVNEFRKCNRAEAQTFFYLIRRKIVRFIAP